MDVFTCLKKLRQVRKFEKKDVDDKLIGVLLYHATQSICAGDCQEWNFIVVKDKEIKEKLYEAALKQSWIKEAPVVIVVCVDLEKIGLKYGRRGEILYAVEDASFAALSIALCAVALGLGTYVVQAFEEDSVKIILQLPDNIRPIFLIALGYPTKEISERKKERIWFENLTWVDRFGQKYLISYYIQPGISMSPRNLEEILEDIKKKMKR